MTQPQEVAAPPLAIYDIVGLGQSFAKTPSEILEMVPSVLSVAQALKYLRPLHQEKLFLAMYKYFFPQQYHASKAAVWVGQGTPPLGKSGNNYRDYANDDDEAEAEYNAQFGGANLSPKDLEFFRLLQQHKFPLSEASYLGFDDEEVAERYLDFMTLDEGDGMQFQLPRLGMEWDESYTNGIYDQFLGWQLLLIMVGEGEAEYLQVEEEDSAYSYEEWVEVLQEVKPIPQRLQNNRMITVATGQLVRLRHICQELAQAQAAPQSEQATSLRNFPLAVEMMLHETGNEFLDPLPEMELIAFWGIEAVKFLSEEYKKAREILDKVTEFVRWVAHSPENLRKVVELWNRSIF